MADGAPQLHTYDDPFAHDKDHNILLELQGEIGDVEAGFAEADVIHEGTYFSPRVQHAHLETHGSIAWMEDGRLNVRTSSQSPSIAKLKLSYLFGLRPDQLRVFCMRVGGGFGGKQELISEDLPALATFDTGRPVCWEYTREEEFTTASPRHPMKCTVKLGAKSDGTLTAFGFRNVSNTGAYGNHGGETLFAAAISIRWSFGAATSSSPATACWRSPSMPTTWRSPRTALRSVSTSSTKPCGSTTAEATSAMTGSSAPA